MGKGVTWKLNNAKLANIDAKGVLTFKGAEGTLRVTATSVSDPGVSAFKDIVVAKNVTKFDTPLKTLYVQTGKKLTIPIVTYDGKTAVTTGITWKSSNTKVATVSKTGVVTIAKNAKNGLKATVTATTASGKKLTVSVIASAKTVKLTKLTVSAPKSMKAGTATKLAVKPGQPKATWQKLTFSSSNAKGLSVDRAGNLTALKKGTYTVTVKADAVTVKKTVKVS